MKTEVMTIKITKTQKQKLEELAERYNRTKSQVLRDAIDLYEDKNIKKRNAGTLFLEFAKEAEKHKYKGPKDLSTNMNKYLYG